MRRIVLALLLVSSATPLFAADPIVLGPYQYDGAGNIRAIGTNESFLYDGDSRLVNAVMTTGTQTFKYDTFGNRTFIDTTPATTRCNGGAGCKREPDPGTLSRTNRIAGATYNAAGAVETMDGRVYTYEPTGMMTSQKNTQLVQYVYTADDERIAVYTNSRWEWSLRDPGAHVIRQVTSDDASTSWSWVDDQIFRAGSMLASERPLIGRRHFHLDHLGTPRLITTDTGTIAGQYEYYAFGTLPDDGSPRETPTEELKFTGHQRDLASGDVHVLDYMHARYYDGAAGRFLAVDTHEGYAESPQSWNRYSYTLDNPIKAIDPDGQETLVIVAKDWIGGDHSALIIARDGDRLLYDPAGSYTPPSDLAVGGRRSAANDIFTGDDARIGPYLNYQRSDGGDVHVVAFNTTPEEEKQIKDRIDNGPQAVAAPWCTTNVSRVLDGIGPFAGLGSHFWPRLLLRKLEKLQQKADTAPHIGPRKPPNNPRSWENHYMPVVTTDGGTWLGCFDGVCE